MKPVCLNRKARFNFFLLESLETGIVLKGAEVKSLRCNRASLDDSFAVVERDGVYLYNCHIDSEDPKRTRKLLLHKAEIERLRGKTERKGLTLIPVSIYFKNGKAKIELALAKGKKVFDKRDDIKKREAEREMGKAKRCGGGL